MAIIEYPLVQLLNYFTSMKPYLTWQTDMCTLEFVLIKNAKYILEPWKLAFIFRIRAWNVSWSKNSWQNLLEAKAYKSVSLMEISKNSCSHVYCCNVYALTTCFITSAHWAEPVQSLILARNVHFILTGFEKENFVNNDRSSPLRKSIRGNIWEGNYRSQSVCFYTNGNGESNWSVGCQFLLGPECFSNKQVTTE